MNYCELLERISDLKIMDKMPVNWLLSLNFTVKDCEGGYGWYNTCIVKITRIFERCSRCGYDGNENQEECIKKYLERSGMLISDHNIKNHRHRWERAEETILMEEVWTEQDVELLGGKITELIDTERSDMWRKSSSGQRFVLDSLNRIDMTNKEWKEKLWKIDKEKFNERKKKYAPFKNFREMNWVLSQNSKVVRNIGNGAWYFIVGLSEAGGCHFDLREIWFEVNFEADIFERKVSDDIVSVGAEELFEKFYFEGMWPVGMNKKGMKIMTRAELLGV